MADGDPLSCWLASWVDLQESALHSCGKLPLVSSDQHGTSSDSPVVTNTIPMFVISTHNKIKKKKSLKTLQQNLHL